jgi:hypothetical protein
MPEIHPDMGHGPDMKYSLWRRYIFPKIVDRRDCYTTDIDWLEWRKGKPVAIIECRRVIGSLKNCKDVISHFRKLNNGFQLEAYARIAYELKIKAFVVAIDDKSESDDSYKDAEFCVEQIVPPNVWPSGRIELSNIVTKRIGRFNEREYAEFISDL